MSRGGTNRAMLVWPARYTLYRPRSIRWYGVCWSSSSTTVTYSRHSPVHRRHRCHSTRSQSAQVSQHTVTIVTVSHNDSRHSRNAVTVTGRISRRVAAAVSQSVGPCSRGSRGSTVCRSADRRHCQPLFTHGDTWSSPSPPLPPLPASPARLPPRPRQGRPHFRSGRGGRGG